MVIPTRLDLDKSEYKPTQNDGENSSLSPTSQRLSPVHLVQNAYRMVLEPPMDSSECSSALRMALWSRVNQDNR